MELANRVPAVTLVTTMGNIELELYWQHAPKTVYNFVELARKGYYDNVTFHRIIRDFMIQGGDPTGTGRGGESVWGKPFPDELHPQLKHTGAGIISMANSGPDTNGPRSLASPAASKQPAEQCAALFAARRRPTNVSI